MKNKLSTEKAIGYGGLLAMMISVIYLAYSGMCLGNDGTRYFMTGQAAHPLVYACSVYDYSKYFPGFEKQSDSLRNFR